MTRLYARSLIGTRARGSKPHQRGKNVSIIGAISIKRIMTSIKIVGSVNKMIFEAFIANKLVPILWKGSYVMIDNCSIHKNIEIEKMIEEAGGKVLYLPPYSPDFSPIENCWSKVKSILRTIGARTYQELDKAIEEAFSQITKEDLRNWFTHCCYCTSDA
jgi:transposase